METISDKIETGQPFGLYDILDELQTSVTALEDKDTAREVLDGVCGATIVVAEKDTDEWYATIQLTDYAGDDMAVAGSVIVYLSSVATGLDFNTATVTTETAITDDGSLAILLAKIAYLVTSEADGDIKLTLTDTGADIYYLVVVLPNGTLVVSEAITFA